MINLRALGLIGLLFSIPTISHADWAAHAVYIQCDEVKGLFAAQSVIGHEGNFEDFKTKNPEGELRSKMEGAKLGSTPDNENYAIVISDDGPKPFQSCKISSPLGTNTYTIERTKIDTGNVQSMCGAAIGAELTIKVDGKTLAVLPSQKDDCYTGNNVQHHPTLSVRQNRITLCERHPFSHYKNGKYQLRQAGEICRTGSAESHLDRMSHLVDSPDRINELTQKDLIERIRINTQKTRSLQAEINTAHRTKDAQDVKFEKLDRQRIALHTQVKKLQKAQDHMNAENQALEQKLEAQKRRKFREKLRDVFRKTEK